MLFCIYIFNRLFFERSNCIFCWTDGNWIFEVIDQNKNSVNVVFSKTLPNLVEENKGIIVEGKFIDNIFIAEIVLAKHDENYMPQSAIDKLKEEGKWRGD